MQSGSAPARSGSLRRRPRAPGCPPSCIGASLFALGQAVECHCRQGRRRSNLQVTKKPRYSAAIAAQRLWEVVKGRELDPEAPPRPQQPWRTRCPRLCESGAAMREAGWWSSRREASAPRRRPAYCSPWPPRGRASPLLGTHLEDAQGGDPAVRAGRAGRGASLRGSPARRSPPGGLRPGGDTCPFKTLLDLGKTPSRPVFSFRLLKTV